MVFPQATTLVNSNALVLLVLPSTNRGKNTQLYAKSPIFHLSMGAASHYQKVYIKDRQAWRTWLKNNYTQNQGIWLVYDKGAGRLLKYTDIVQEALCFGWIDSLPRLLSDTQSQILVSPRKKGSGWSAVNKKHIIELEEKYQIHPSGQKVIDEAKENGSWSKLDEAESLKPNAHFQDALHNSTEAYAFWKSLSKSAQKGVLIWMSTAKTDTTRNKRAQDWVDAALKGKDMMAWNRNAKKDIVL